MADTCDGEGRPCLKNMFHEKEEIKAAGMEVCVDQNRIDR